MTPACHRFYNRRSVSHFLTLSSPRSPSTRLVASTQTTSFNSSITGTQRRFSANSTDHVAPRNPAEHVVVLGGGITGLAAAFYLTRCIPQARITLIEHQDRVGGWVRSERIEMGPGKGHMVLEAGPRTLRPRSQALLELVRPHSFRYETTSNPSDRSTSLDSNAT
jgi:NADPH-dependent 2,4-dienoyl-CoA reductase/sulfur reductase-like enzyme